MAASSQKQSEILSDLLAKVIGVRHAAKEEYEKKLKKHLENRIKNMSYGIFDGARLPDINHRPIQLQENLQKTTELIHKIQFNSDRYFFAKETSQQLHGQLTQVAETLQKAAEIEQILREQ